MSIELEEVYKKVETMTPDAKELYYFAIKTIFENDELALSNLLASNSSASQKGDLTKAFTNLRDFCVIAAMVADAEVTR